jgi:glycosyltransferase involved in cell wall biosynthesis
MRTFSGAVREEGSMKRILILHPNLRIGGAETQLLNFLEFASNHLQVTLALYSAEDDVTRERVLDDRIDVISLRKSVGTLGMVSMLARLVGLVRRTKPDIIMSYLMHTNLVGAFIGVVFRVDKIVWGLRISPLAKEELNLKARMVEFLGRKCSSLVDLVISNNVTGLTAYRESGLRPKKAVFIPNGIVLDSGSGSSSTREEVLQSIGVDPATLVIGQVARVVPWKGYETLINAAVKVQKTGKHRTSFVCIGGGEQEVIKRYQQKVSEAGLKECFFWLGPRSDVDWLLNGIDIFTLASTSGEGFSNALVEAMSNGIPCVVSDVGDSPLIVGKAGFVTPAGDSERLANVWEQLLGDQVLREECGVAGRLKVLREFSLMKCNESMLENILEVDNQK